jgi:hypothetical protein
VLTVCAKKKLTVYISSLWPAGGVFCYLLLQVSRLFDWLSWVYEITDMLMV